MSVEFDGDPQARLVDIVVEEVSLVDRAANKRRFLVVKREVGGGRMEGGTKPADATEGTPTDGNETGSSSPADGSQPNASTPDTLEGAIGAVEELCEATLALSEQARNEADVARVIALAGQVELLASSLTESAPGAPASATRAPGDGDAPPGQGPTEKSTQSAPSTLASAFADIERRLAEARAVLVKVVPKAAGATPEPEPAPPPPPASAPTPPSAPAPTKDAAAEPTLRSVMDAIAGLTKAVHTQGDRIGKLEKGVGAPNSQPVNERQRDAADDGEVSWPMDLNVRVDRAGVDKRVSFHDD